MGRGRRTRRRSWRQIGARRVQIGTRRRRHRRRPTSGRPSSGGCRRAPRGQSSLVEGAVAQLKSILEQQSAALLANLEGRSPLRDGRGRGREQATRRVRAEHSFARPRDKRLRRADALDAKTAVEAEGARAWRARPLRTSATKTLDATKRASAATETAADLRATHPHESAHATTCASDTRKSACVAAGNALAASAKDVFAAHTNGGPPGWSRHVPRRSRRRTPRRWRARSRRTCPTSCCPSLPYRREIREGGNRHRRERRGRARRRRRRQGERRAPAPPPTPPTPPCPTPPTRRAPPNAAATTRQPWPPPPLKLSWTPPPRSRRWAMTSRNTCARWIRRTNW